MSTIIEELLCLMWKQKVWKLILDEIKDEDELS